MQMALLSLRDSDIISQKTNILMTGIATNSHEEKEFEITWFPNSN